MFVPYLTTGELFYDAIRSFFFTFDKAIYSFAGKIYEIIVYLTSGNLSIFENEAFENIAKNIYGLLSVVMLFYLAFMALRYIANPDEMSDKSKGAFKLIQRVFITFVLILIVPSVFNFTAELQTKIIKDKVLPQLVFGNSSAKDNIYNNKNAGELIAASTFNAFVTVEGFPDSGIDAVADLCKQKYDTYKESADENSSIFSVYENCIDYRAKFDANLSGGKKYMYGYSLLISTIAGIVLCWVLIQYCFDIGLRMVKLGFLQATSPIFIISYIDSKSASGGMFSKWLKECINTYLSLFIKIFVLFFAIFLLGFLSDSTWAKEAELLSIETLLKAFIMYSILMFMPEVPKLINKFFGIESKFKVDPFLGKVTGGLIGGTTAAAATGAGLLTAGTGGFLRTGLGLTKSALFNKGKGDNRWDDFNNAKKVSWQNIKDRATLGALNTGKQTLNGFNSGFKNVGDVSKLANNAVDDYAQAYYSDDYMKGGPFDHMAANLQSKMNRIAYSRIYDDKDKTRLERLPPEIRELEMKKRAIKAEIRAIESDLYGAKYDDDDIKKNGWTDAQARQEEDKSYAASLNGKLNEAEEKKEYLKAQQNQASNLASRYKSEIENIKQQYEAAKQQLAQKEIELDSEIAELNTNKNELDTKITNLRTKLNKEMSKPIGLSNQNLINEINKDIITSSAERTSIESTISAKSTQKNNLSFNFDSSQIAIDYNTKTASTYDTNDKLNDLYEVYSKGYTNSDGKKVNYDINDFIVSNNLSSQDAFQLLDKTSQMFSGEFSKNLENIKNTKDQIQRRTREVDARNKKIADHEKKMSELNRRKNTQSKGNK